MAQTPAIHPLTQAVRDVEELLTKLEHDLSGIASTTILTAIRVNKNKLTREYTKFATEVTL